MPKYKITFELRQTSNSVKHGFLKLHKESKSDFDSSQFTANLYLIYLGKSATVLEINEI